MKAPWINRRTKLKTIQSRKCRQKEKGPEKQTQGSLSKTGHNENSVAQRENKSKRKAIDGKTTTK